MNLSIHKAVFRRFPSLRVAFLRVDKMDNSSKLGESQQLLRQAEQLARAILHRETRTNRYLISPWAVAQQEFGRKAHHYHTSAERLLQRVLARKNIAKNDVLTNIVYYLALKYILPLEVDDLSKVQGTVRFSLATRKEKRGVLKTLSPGELYYRDSKGVLGAKLDYWKSNRCILSKKTSQALVHLEALPPITTKQLNDVVTEAEGLIRSFTGGVTQAAILSRRKTEAIL